MKRLVSSLLLGAGLFVGGCAVNTLNTDPEVRGLSGQISPQRLTDPASGSEVVLSQGNQLILELRSNPTTGYMWSVLSGADTGVMSLVSEDYIGDDNPRGMVGVGGQTVFVFNADQVGETTLSLGYARSGSTPDDALDIHVSVIPR
ncbi:protease inhibitor I42 family protein [Ponticaulis sp.]|uniref:protease inhibitor I42 family protein n=1 Tax=Ponticaulis sp. TaxID=2020902 RepID=UPI0025CC3BD7|nr:protease inhibitor I42 family protein [Ponticaulis sp.]|tara:strand:+ start:485 stop:922 length:438 start_codon:yes stop_codon:yes gene_type:complete